MIGSIAYVEGGRTNGQLYQGVVYKTQAQVAQILQHKIRQTLIEEKVGKCKLTRRQLSEQNTNRRPTTNK